jgi:hypothetical protein
VKEGVKAQAAEAEARQKALHEAQRKQLAETDAELKAQYGDRYGHALEMLRRGVGDSGIDAALAQAGLGGNPLVIRAFIALGESMKESASPKGASSAAGGMKSVLEGGGFTYKA